MNMYELWSKVCEHQVTGLMYHFQFADMFYFLGLDCLGKEQERHYREESNALRDSHKFVLEHHRKIITENRVENVDLIPSAWTKYTAGDVDKSVRKSQVMSIFDTWLTWETKTRDYYVEMYQKAEEQHAVLDCCRLKELILCVEKELARIQKCINKLKMCDYSPEAMLSL